MSSRTHPHASKQSRHWQALDPFLLPDILALVEWAAEHRTVKGFPGGDAFDGPEVLTWNVDVLIPAALEDAITKDNAGEIQASMVVEAANGPTTPEADEILQKRRVLVIPDILANAGGVTVSNRE